LVEIKPERGGEALMVPFTDAAVPEIDMTARRMVVKPLSETE
jgi:ribosomal 30S subunit maturation factor RimM